MLNADAENAKRDAELRAQYVVVPPGDKAKPISCPICEETLRSEFLEDDEDWVWKNAVLKDERVRLLSSHRDCRLDMTSAQGDNQCLPHGLFSSLRIR